MQFNKNGPDIPSRLVQAHEDGRVVFFCGAGVSYPAGLPGFGNLVAKIYDELGEAPNQVEAAALNASHYDTAVALMERRFGRSLVRAKLAAILTSAKTDSRATATHKAMLDLARLADGRTRLITTNFDRLFEAVKPSGRERVMAHCAPYLPVPKNRWNGLVYLHGLIPSDWENESLDHLVVSSGDFGLAYLTERWASRFVSELFRNYVVCFVGYSLNDPVLRYMTDALAADKALGESTLEMFAFASFDKGKEEEVRNEWLAKNVTPILYQSTPKHTNLHGAVQEWAKVYRSGATGKEAIVSSFASANPLGATKQDDFAKRMMWALSDKSGTPAKKFANFDPLPSLDWLKPLTDTDYRYDDLAQFGVASGTKDDALAYSILERPSPYTLAPYMAVIATSRSLHGWDEVMWQMAAWLVRHLDKPELLIWVVQKGARVHPTFAQMIERALEQGAALPRPMSALWRFILLGRVHVGHGSMRAYSWVESFRKMGLTATLRFELRLMLSPKLLVFSAAPSVPELGEVAVDSGPTVRCELTLATDDARGALADLREEDAWRSAMPYLLDEFVQLLLDALDIRRELGEIDNRVDYSYIAQPSISPSSQNQDLQDWTLLIELVRDAWDGAARGSPNLALATARRFMAMEYPLFKRLAFYAGTSGVVPVAEAVSWLCSDDCYWLWSSETEREALRLVAGVAGRADRQDWLALEDAILRGIPDGVLREYIDDERRAQINDRQIWLRLKTALTENVMLSQAASNRLEQLERAYPDWRLSEDQREEFPVWSGGDDDWRIFVTVPKEPELLVKYLRSNPTLEFPKEDDWRERCQVDPIQCMNALLDLASQNLWLSERWSQALQAWSTDSIAAESWNSVAGQLLFAPGKFLSEIAGALTWWIQAVVRTDVRNDALLFGVLRLVLASVADQEWEPGDDAVFIAINHPIGRLVEVGLAWWFKQSLEDDIGLPENLTEFLDNIVGLGFPKSMPALVVLASHAVTLFRVDKRWFRENLLPFFDWSQGEDIAQPVWEGFLRAPRIYYPLLDELRVSFIETAKKYTRLRKYGNQYAAVLTYVSVERRASFAVDELRKATRELPISGLERVAQTIVSLLEGSGEKRPEYWEERVKPYIHGIWPKDSVFRTERVSKSFSEICIGAGSQFPDAVKTLRRWLVPIGDWHWPLKKLNDSEIVARYPGESLSLVAAIVHSPYSFDRGELHRFLLSVEQADKALLGTPEFSHLKRVDEAGKQ